jgi:hypothetical protein
VTAPREVVSRTWQGAAPCALALSVLAACAASDPVVRLRVDAASNVNDERSVYVLVRTVQESDFQLESYDEVAAQVVHPDDSVVDMAVALPGVPLSFSLKSPPPKKRVAVYAMFERPVCGAWRVLLPEKVPAFAELRLEDGRLCFVGEGGECVVHGCGSTVATAGSVKPKQ